MLYENSGTADNLSTEFTWIIIIFFIVLVLLFIHLILRWFKLYNRNQQLTKPQEPEITLKKIPSPKFKLMMGGTYLILEHTEKDERLGFKVFKDILRTKAEGLVITRSYPQKIVKKFDLNSIPVIWLTRSKNKNSITPTNLGKIIDEIKEHTTQNENTIILFDGLEYLTVHNDFERVMKFLHSLKDEIAVHNSRLIISLNPKTLNRKKIALLTKELKVLN